MPGNMTSTGLSLLESLPDELIYHVLAFLDIPSLISLHRVSSRIRSVTRFDGLIWQQYCLPNDSVRARLGGTGLGGASHVQPLHLRQNQPGKITIRDRRGLLTHPYVCDYEETAIDWYKEFQYRNAKLSEQSFVKFRAPDNLEIVDITLAGGQGAGLEDMVAASALADGSICLFSLSDRKLGTVLGRSSSDLVARKSLDIKAYRSPGESGTGVNYERGLFVNAATAYENRAWFGAGSVLTEVDLVTMRRIRTHRFPFSVTCLSTVLPVLAVGTTLTLHLLDPRAPSDYIATTPISTPGSVSDGEKVDPSNPAPTRFLDSTNSNISIRKNAAAQDILDNDERSSRDYLLNAPPTAFLQPSPLSILHSPIDQAGGNEMYVAGRFPSIMAYDRRQWPRLAGTIHSGTKARLSDLTLITANSSLPQNPVPSKYFLAACGEYDGRGTLEVYPLPSTENEGEIQNSKTKLPLSTQRMYSKASSMATRNRQSASRGKIFSIASQGLKLVIGDSEGRIRFMERDGVRHVRDWVGPSNCDEESINYIPTSGGCVRKILPLIHPRADLRPSVENADLLLQIGEEAGVLTFNPTHMDTSSENSDLAAAAPDSMPLTDENPDEERYLRVMRNALEQHHSELRFLQGLDP
ncbi:hypothetical protein DRE_05116 [Drechslerella stenobrocha 248]|uniref:F-box domain-containing protein n=1 Tax=Drechslerella stenobrocha 248 TaxID=1043628 RepID=W7HRG5_9PEZI|nr:hypothetical protein DRE_05116 [Drechslerella stenobrocha 248]